jgi:hypothetical protein
MPDNWGYVFAAYAVAAVAVAGYWRRLRHRRRALAAPVTRKRGQRP